MRALWLLYPSITGSQKTRAVNDTSAADRALLPNLLTLLVFPFVWATFLMLTLLELVQCFVLDRSGTRYSQPNIRSDLAGELTMDEFDPTDSLDWERLRSTYVARGIPFVLRRTDGGALSAIGPPTSATSGPFSQGCIRVSALAYLTPLPGLDPLIARLFPWTPRAYWPFWFLGKYSQGKAHTDLGPHVCNCYFMRSGTKDVVIVPAEVTRALSLTKGLDGLFIDGSESEGREYLRALPYYYRVDLQPQSILVFNNASCIHQFRNRQAADGTWPQALSVRVKYIASASPRLWKHMTTDWRMMWRFSSVYVSQALFHTAEDREAKYL